MIKLTHFIFVAIFLSFSASAFSQTVTFESAKANYDAKEYEKAVEDFKTLSKTDKNNAIVWNYLGLSYRAIDEGKKSVSAFKKAISLAPANNSIRFNYAFMLSETGSSKALKEIEIILAADPKQKETIYLRAMTYLRQGKFDKAKADSERLIELDPSSIDGYLIALTIREREINARIIERHSTAFKEISFFKEIVDLLEKGSKLCGDCKDHKAFEYQLGIRQKLLEQIEKMDNDYQASTTIPSPPGEKLEDKQFTIISKPRAFYTNVARNKGISGTVKILVLFGSSGQIEGAILKNSIGGGLDENALTAARQIKFTPRIEDGKPITIMRTVEYSFTIY